MQIPQTVKTQFNTGNIIYFGNVKEIYVTNANYLSDSCMVNLLIEVDKYRGGSCLSYVHPWHFTGPGVCFVHLFCNSYYYFSWIFFFFLSCMEVEMKYNETVP